MIYIYIYIFGIDSLSFSPIPSEMPSQNSEHSRRYRCVRGCTADTKHGKVGGELQPQSQQLPLPIRCSTAPCRLPAGLSRLKINPGSGSSGRRDQVRALCSAGAAPLPAPWLPHIEAQGRRAAIAASTAPGHRMCEEVD